MARYDIRKPPGILHDGDGDERLGWDLMGELYPLFEFARDPVDKSLNILRWRCILRLLDLVNICFGMRISLTNDEDLRALLSVDKNAKDTLRHTQELPYLSNRPDIVEISRRRIVRFRFLL